MCNSGVRHHFVGCTLDGNCFEQAHQCSNQSKANPRPTSNCGVCYPGNNANSNPDIMNMQFAYRMGMEGINSPTNRLKFATYGCRFLNNTSDGVRGFKAPDGIVENCIFSQTARGGLVFDGSHILLRTKDNVYLLGPQLLGSGFDHEMLSTQPADIRHLDDWNAHDFDAIIQGSTYSTSSPELSPDQRWIWAVSIQAAPSGFTRAVPRTRAGAMAFIATVVSRQMIRSHDHGSVVGLEQVPTT
jgi:hypothetical protein